MCFAHEDDKMTVISHSNLLHHHSQFERVFTAPDQTKLELEKYVKLVNELKEGKAKGETNVIIRNGCIILDPPILQVTLFLGDKSLVSVLLILHLMGQ